MGSVINAVIWRLLEDKMNLSFEHLPTKPWFRIIFGSKSGLSNAADFPYLEAEWRNAAPQNLAAYQDICGFPVTNRLPITYPQVLATPLHLHLLAVKGCPLKLMGLVHVGQSIQYHSPYGR